MKKLISVIVPVYNVENCLKKCVLSILNNTYKKIEVILVDDGSTDRSPDICDEFMNNDNRIIVIHKKNGGLSSARNTGLNVHKGEYVFFVDSDDWIEHNTFEVLLENAEKSKSDIVECGYIKEFSNGKKQFFEPKVMLLENKENIAQELLLQKSLVVNVWNKLYTSKVIGNVRFQEGKNNEDNLFMIDLLNNIKKISILSTMYYHYVIRSNSITQSKTSIKKVEDWYFALNYMKNYIDGKYITLKNISLYCYCKGLFFILLLFDQKEPSPLFFDSIFAEYKSLYKRISKDKVYREQNFKDRLRLLLLYLFGINFLNLYCFIFKKNG